MGRGPTSVGAKQVSSRMAGQIRGVTERQRPREAERERQGRRETVSLSSTLLAQGKPPALVGAALGSSKRIFSSGSSLPRMECPPFSPLKFPSLVNQSPNEQIQPAAFWALPSLPRPRGPQYGRDRASQRPQPQPPVTIGKRGDPSLRLFPHWYRNKDKKILSAPCLRWLRLPDHYRVEPFSGHLVPLSKVAVVAEKTLEPVLPWGRHPRPWPRQRDRSASQ